MAATTGVSVKQDWFVLAATSSPCRGQGRSGPVGCFEAWFVNRARVGVVLRVQLALELNLRLRRQVKVTGRVRVLYTQLQTCP